MIETHKNSVASDEKLTELNYSKCSIGRKGGFSNMMISSAVPRYQVFKLTDTILDIKTKIYERCAPMFDDTDVDEEWINTNLVLQIKDNTPMGRGGGKLECEFCSRHHTSRDDYCDVRTDEHSDGNEMEAAKDIKFQDLYDQLKYKRDVIF